MVPPTAVPSATLKKKVRSSGAVKKEKGHRSIGDIRACRCHKCGRHFRRTNHSLFLLAFRTNTKHAESMQGRLRSNVGCSAMLADRIRHTAPLPRSTGLQSSSLLLFASMAAPSIAPRELHPTRAPEYRPEWQGEAQSGRARRTAASGPVPPSVQRRALRTDRRPASMPRLWVVG